MVGLVNTPISRCDCLTCKARSCSILEYCDNDTLQAVSYFKIKKTVPKGKRLFSEGELVQGVYFIKNGFLKIELNSGQDKSLILCIMGQGNILGHRINSTHLNHTHTATAVTDVECCFIPYAKFNKIVENNPVFKQQIISQFLRELEISEKRVINLVHKSVREKVAEAILMLAEVYKYEDTGYSFRICFDRQDIAWLIGTTKQQVSKIIKDFEKEGLIKCSGKKFNYLAISQLQQISSNI